MRLIQGENGVSGGVKLAIGGVYCLRVCSDLQRPIPDDFTNGKGDSRQGLATGALRWLSAFIRRSRRRLRGQPAATKWLTMPHCVVFRTATAFAIDPHRIKPRLAPSCMYQYNDGPYSCRYGLLELPEWGSLRRRMGFNRAMSVNGVSGYGGLKATPETRSTLGIRSAT